MDEYWRGIKASMLGRMEFFTRRMFMYVNEMSSRYIFHPPLHEKICAALDEVVAGKCRKLIINVPPRYGKTELVSRMFVAYGLARNPASKFINLSYSADLVEGNSEAVKRTVTHPLYERLFGVQVDRNRKNTTKEWYTTAGGGLYVAPFHGQITGFGAGQVDPEDDGIDGAAIDGHLPEQTAGRFAGALVIDDPMKTVDATSDRIRNGINQLFETTIRTRVNSRRTPIIIIMQRLHENDLCGYLIKKEGVIEEGGAWKVLSLPALRWEGDREVALWPHMHTVEELHAKRALDPLTFDTQYMQNPTPAGDMLYTRLQTYRSLPAGDYIVKNYTDPAGRGTDDTVSVDYAEFIDTGECYVFDAVCTDAGVETTRSEIARMMDRDEVEVAYIESNGLGDPFALLVKEQLRLLGNSWTRIETFPQKGNKESRILNNSATVQNCLYLPEGWETRWPRLHAGAMGYRRSGGTRQHDDVPDAFTGIMEHREQGAGWTMRTGTYMRAQYD